MIEDSEVDELRRIADRIRAYAEECYYGAYNGGDPRDFHPDPECSTDEERALWEADCAAWEAGNPVDRGPSHVPLDQATDSDPAATVYYPGGGGHKTVQHYGLGTVTFRDPELMRMAQDLDDWIDRVRQISK